MIEILKMNESHVTAVAELEKQNFSEPWSENSVRGELGNQLSLWLVAVKPLSRASMTTCFIYRRTPL